MGGEVWIGPAKLYGCAVDFLAGSRIARVLFGLHTLVARAVRL